MNKLSRFKKQIKQRFPVRRWLRSVQRSLHLQRHSPGTLHFGDLRRLTPVSRLYGRDRGLPIHRYYIETFLSCHAPDIQGHVLEIGDDTYTRKFGGPRVARSDVLHVVEGNPQATIVADLTCADHLPGDQFDCIIFTQTLQMIYDIRSALRHLHRILKPGGVLLVTSHGITQIHRREGRDDWGEYWHFTSQSSRRLFGEFFPATCLEIEVYGNVLTAIGYLQGLSAEELSPEELDYSDPDYEVIIGVRAVKARAAKGR